MAETDTKTDILDSQDAAIIAAIVVIDGLHDVPTADAASNTYMRDVIGNKIDAAVTVTTTIKSIMAYIKGALNLLNLIQPDSSDNLSTAMTELEAILDTARSGDSGTTVTDGNEQTIYELIDGTAALYNVGYVDLSLLEGGDTLLISVYAKIKSGGAYVRFSDDTAYTFAGVQDPPLIVISGEHATIYGFKITMELTVGSNRSIDHEFFDSKQGG